MSGWEELRREIEALPGFRNRDDELHPGFVSRAAVLAAIDRAALSGSTAPLDVERLARAIHIWHNPDWVAGATCDKGCRHDAERIAAEYARIAASPDPAQGGGTRG